MKLPHRRQFLYLAAGAALGGAAAWLATQARQYGGGRALQLQVLRLQAEVVAAKIDQFIGGIEGQISWTLLLSWSVEAMDQRRFNAAQLLRQVPAISEFSQFDPLGNEQLRLSRFRSDAPEVDPKCFREKPVPTGGEVGGLGIYVTTQDDLIKVVTPLDDGAAAKAGVLANDIITRLDNEEVHGLTLNQAVEKMRGPLNTKIKLTI